MKYCSFGVRLQEAMSNNSSLCVGIDPHPQLLSAWGLPNSCVGLREFSLRVLDAVGGVVAAVKPQIAFFERFGSGGIAVLEEVLSAASALNILTILDAKRGDIGSTMEAYAQTFLANNSSLAADAVTLSPYLGFGSLQPAFDLAAKTGRGVFVLALTSNVSGASVQHATVLGESFGGGDISVAKSIFKQTVAENEKYLVSNKGGFGFAGLVIGATVGQALQALAIDIGEFNGPILVPGFGAQGATVADVREVFGRKYGQVLVTSSRDILQAGPDVLSLRDKAKKVADYLR